MLVDVWCRNNREAIDRVVEMVLEKETVSGDEFRTILQEYTTIPEEHLRLCSQVSFAPQAMNP